MWIIPLSIRKSSASKIARMCDFFLEHQHKWILQGWGRLTRNSVRCKGIWEAVRDDTWPFEASRGIEVKATPGGLQNHLTFPISDGPNKKKPESQSSNKVPFQQFIEYIYLKYLFDSTVRVSKTPVCTHHSNLHGAYIYLS